MNRKGFTLIELLIVVAIIAILAAIAVPNFLEAQMRSKVARVKADMRTAELALEAYKIDNNQYPHLKLYADGGKSQWDRGGLYAATSLSTPVAYLTTTMLADPFTKNGRAYNEYGDFPGDNSVTIHYVNSELGNKLWKLGRPEGVPKYYLISLGPDYIKGPDPRPGVANPFGWGIGSYNAMAPAPTGRHVAWYYDPTNGTVSYGDILREEH